MCSKNERQTEKKNPEKSLKETTKQQQVWKTVHTLNFIF